MEYDRSSALLDLWVAYDALSGQMGADRAAIEKLLVLGLARLERDQNHWFHESARRTTPNMGSPRNLFKIR
jgi:hypothetical protein